MSTYEQRLVHGAEFEIRTHGKDRKIAGWSPVFDSESKDLGGFTEITLRSAVTQTVAQDRIYGTYNHDMEWPTADTKSGTLVLNVGERAVEWEMDVVRSSRGDDMLQMVEAGIVDTSSFGFRKAPSKDDVGDRWQTHPTRGDGFQLRTLTRIRIRDIGPVVNEAYPASTAHMVNARAALENLATETRSLDELVEAYHAGELHKILTPQDDDGSENRTEVDLELVEMRRQRMALDAQLLAQLG